MVNYGGTYRVQLHSSFGLNDAKDLVPYLTKLGVSHLYTSPILQAVGGSSHGYDVVNPDCISHELGGQPAFDKLYAALKSSSLKLMVDIVPNHMAIDSRQNPWWWDVLENGPSSHYALYFDVDWEASSERWPNKILLPLLEDHYGRVLEDGKMQLSYAEGIFQLHYHEHTFPIDPSSITTILSKAASSVESEMLTFLAESYAHLPHPTVVVRTEVKRRHRDKAMLQKLLRRLCEEEPMVLQAIEQEVDRLNGDADALDNLIDQQNYRLALWRCASRDLGYRRFFDIKDLAGLRTEDPEVFFATHHLPIALVAEKKIQGLRIDHPDGLRNPSRYFLRLKEVCPTTWIVAEKILMPEETLPHEWPIAGTTGYDFLNEVGGLFIDQDGEQALNKAYESFIGETSDYRSILRESKRLVLTELLVSELNRLTNIFVTICEKHRRYRDYTRHELKTALCEVATFFPVYRTYVEVPGNNVSEKDKLYITQAVDQAQKTCELDQELCTFLRDILLLRIQGTQEGELAMRFQQLTSAAMAKGAEDTAFYRYVRLLCLNEVGGDPSKFGTSLKEFHEKCYDRLQTHPLSMLATTTHDTKRSEDVRTRIALLSECPQKWHAALTQWREIAAPHRPVLIDPISEYLFYQTLVGAWPLEIKRVQAYLEKALREAKKYTSWTNINIDYEQQWRQFSEVILQDKAFLESLESFVKELIYPGRVNSLAQTLIKLTAPGIPDIYQGSELWTMTLVDPDNRTPVDFELRQEMLADSITMNATEAMARIEEGMPKMWLTRKVLQQRKKRPDLFSKESSYKPMYADGPMSKHVVAFCRGEAALTVAPRLNLGWGDGDDATSIELPKGEWRCLLSEKTYTEKVLLKDLWRIMPVSLLIRKDFL